MCAHQPSASSQRTVWWQDLGSYRCSSQVFWLAPDREMQTLVSRERSADNGPQGEVHAQGDPPYQDHSLP